MGMQFIKLEPNYDIRQYLQQQQSSRTRHDVEAWLQLPEVPANEEVQILPDEEVELLPNKIRGKWKSTQRYLKAHFELLREDALSPLRDAVDVVKNNPNMMDNHDLSIYEKVHCAGFTFSTLGIAARIRFSTRRAQRRILWSGSKRLVSGGLVALTPAEDMFQKECILAIVAARPLSGVQSNPPEIDLFFPRPSDMQIDPQKQFVMVEARSGYYEAYRHTLQALQKMSSESFPLSAHLCSMSPDIEAPLHVKINPAMNLDPARLDSTAHSYGVVDVMNHWPEHNNSGLDETQWQALNRILTKSLAVIQGPPGTGKTFVSTVALEILHSHLKGDDPPIIIAAQTNHALDQLLNHVARFEPHFIRLGGRSTSAEVKKRALYEVRRENRIDIVPGSLLRKAGNVYNQQSKELREILEPLRDAVNTLDLAAFTKQGAISEEQADSLVKGAARWISADDSEINPIEHWLGDALSRFEVEYEAETFGFDEEDEDLETEQLRERETEEGVHDEEDLDQMRGPWCAIFDHFVADSSSEVDQSEEAELLLHKHQDLGKVPMHMRGHVYAAMKQRLKETLLRKFRELAAAYQKNMDDLRIGRWERDICFLKQARIIGLTTTGLSKYRPLLSALKPKVVLIEEAAEVLEAPVSVACMESVEQLILVGDHEQLRGHTSVRELEGQPYYLDVSLFERLVKNNMPYSTLLRQRRMDPEFRRLIQPIYPLLIDHPSVNEREILDYGLGKVKSFFFDHRWLESRDGQMSTLNEEEARFIAAFYRYMVLYGLPAAQVTVLTFYNGQRKRLLKEIRAYPELKQVYNNVKTVDSYQGEEVRSGFAPSAFEPRSECHRFSRCVANMFPEYGGHPLPRSSQL
jgi:helicase required for RNAi-mediated heterochromatin assembly 1